MGERAKDMLQDVRRVATPLQCAWCRQVRVNMDWRPDRRTDDPAAYSHGICPVCRVTHFLQRRPPLSP